MKTLQYCCTVMFLIALFPLFALSQTTGDYRSAVNNGNWGTAATWETYNGSSWVVAGAQPGATNDVTIRNGFNVILDASGKNCKNLTIDSGAIFKTNVALPTSSIRYVRVNGTTMTVNGTFGEATTGDAIALEGLNTGGTITISGTGTFAPSRVRINSGSNTCTIVFNMDTKFMYTGSSGTGGNALYPQTDNNTFTLNAGKTMTFVNYASLAVGSGSSATGQNLTLNIYGTVDLSPVNSNLYLKVTTGKTATVNIFSGGSMTIGGNVNNSTVADAGSTVITNDGSFTAGGTVDFSNPAFVMTGTGTFTLNSGATLNMGHVDGISSSGSTGQIQTTTRNFNTGSNYGYVGTSAQVTGNGLPSSVNNLTFSNSSGVTVTAATVVNGAFQTNGGAINGSNLTLNGTATLNAGGYFDSSPTYGPASTLIYNTGNTFGRYTEWNANSGAGHPANVIITDTTILNYPNGSTPALAIPGNLTIDAGSALYMDYGSPGMNNPLTVGGNVTLAGSLSLGDAVGGDLKVGGNWINNGGSFNANSRAVEMNGSTPQILGGTSSTTFPYLTINNNNGVTLGQPATVNNTLTLTSGNVIAGANTLSIGAGGAVSRTSGHVIGLLKKNVPTGAGVNPTFEIGSTTDYLPVSVTFANVGTAGDLSVSTTDLDHPNLASSGIDPAKSVNRYWTMSNSGIAFDTYDATFNFATGDVDGGANTASFLAQKYSGGSWTDLTEGTLTATSSQITGATAFSDFAIGEVAVIPAPGFSLLPSSLSFGSLEINTTTTDSAYVKNGGTDTLNISAVVSDNSPTFAVLPASAVVLPGDSAWFIVTFAPTTPGAATANIVFTHDAAGSPDTLTASGAGVFTGAIMSNGTGGGDWAMTSTWLAGIVPGPTDDVVIQGTDSVYVAASTGCDTLTIATGGVLAVLSGQTLSASVTAISGTLDNAGTFTPTTSLAFAGAGLYRHSQNGGTIPTALWGTGTTCKVTGAAGNAPSNINQNFYNFIWNCPSQSTNLSLGWSMISIGGDFVVSNSGSGTTQLRMTTNAAAGTPNTININGDVIIDGTNAYLTTSGSSGADTVVVNIGGSLELSSAGGTLALGSNSSLYGLWNLQGDFIFSNGTFRRSGTLSKLVFMGSGTQHYNRTGGTILSGSSSPALEVGAGSTLDMASNVYDNGTFTLNPGGGLITAHTSGIDGNLTTTGTKTLNLGASYTFNGSSAQVTGALFPVAVEDLTLDNASGLTLTSNVQVNGALTFTNGILATGSNTVAMAATGSIVGAGATKYVNGYLEKIMAAGPDLKTFEVGDAVLYAPVDISGTYSSPFAVSVKTTSGDHTDIANSTIDVGKSVNRYYTLLGTPTDPSDITFHFDVADIDGGANTSNFKIEKYNGSWSTVPVGVLTGTSAQATGVASFSDFAIGEQEPLVIMSNGTNGGDWAMTTTWQGGIVPTAIDSVVILGSDSVYVQANTLCGGLSILAGGKLAMFAKLTPTNITLSGTMIASTDTMMQSGAMTVENGGVYNHARNGGRIPTATWNAGSTLLVTGLVGNAPSNGNQNYANVTWNCAGQTSNLNLGWNNNTVNGTITVLASGASSRWQLCAPLTGDSAFVTINGDVIVSGGQLSTNGTSNGNTKIVVTHTGNVNVTGGNFSISRGSQGGTGTATWYINNGNFAMSNATTQNSNAAGAKFVIASGTTNLTLGAGNTLTALPMEVATGATLNTGVSMLRGSGIFTLNSGANLVCGQDGGLDSALQNVGTKTLNAGANYTFNGSAAQITGIVLPAIVNDLTIDNTAGVTLSGSVQVNGVLTFTNGKITTGANTATIGTSGSVSGAGAGKYVNGNLNKTMASGADTKTFEIGDASVYTPVVIQGAAYSGAFDVTAATTAGDHAELASSVLDPAKSVNRSYSLTGTPTGFSDVTFNFVAGDVDGGANTSNFVVGKYDSPTWSLPSVGARTATSITATVSDFSDFAIGEYGTVTITATAGSNGSIDPSGAVTVPYDGSQAFTFSPGTGYHVDSVFVDGNYVDTATTSYTFANVTTPHTIHVTFAINTYTLTLLTVGTGEVDKNPEQATYNHGSNVELTADPATGWNFSAWSGDASGSVNPLMVTMDANKTITATFVQDSAYLAKYRTLHPDSIYLDVDNAGKRGKSVKAKADKVEFTVTLKPDSNNVNDLHVEFSLSIDTTFEFTVTPAPDSMSPVAKSTNKKWNIYFPAALDTDDVVTIYGWSKKGSNQKVSSFWWTRNGVMVGKKKSKGAVIVNTLRLPMPNRLNVMEETYKQGLAGGAVPLVIGVAQTNKDSIKKYGWVYLKTAADFYKSLGVTSKTGHNLHDSVAKGFEKVISGKSYKAMTGKYTSFPPTKRDNVLFASLAALKLSIAASALEKTPNGLGELEFEDTTANPLNGLMLKEIAAKADTMMTGYPGRTFENEATYTNLNHAIRRVLEAFEGPMDTVSFAGVMNTKMKGTQALIDVPFLRANSSVTPAKITPVESVELLPEQYELQQNYPNPFNPATTIEFSLPVVSTVTLKIYNLLGQEIATVLDHQEMEEGTQMLEFNASSLPSGVYFYRINAESVDEDGAVNSFTSIKKMLLMK